MSRLRYAVIVTHDRPGDFADCLAAISPQVHHVIVIAHRATYAYGVRATVVDYDHEVPHIGEMWNFGLFVAEVKARTRSYDVAVLNDDAIVPSDWFECVTRAMRGKEAAAGCIHRVSDSRMAGFAFILDGDKHLYADEQFRWWYGDTDLQRRAALAGGVAFAVGPGVEHRHPNSTTVGTLALLAKEDRQRFNLKWGTHV